METEIIESVKNCTRKCDVFVSGGSKDFKMMLVELQELVI